MSLLQASNTNHFSVSRRMGRRVRWRLAILGRMTVAICGVMLLTPPAGAIEPGQASNFLQMLGDEAIATLSEDGIDRQTRETRLRTLLDRGFAFDLIGQMVLGRHWRRANETQRARYLRAFEQLTVRTYAAGFEQYSGETFRIISERSGGKQDRLVETEIRGSGGRPLKVFWRVREVDASLKIIDVLIEGISMTVTKRSEFSAVVQRNGGNVDSLIDAIEAKLAAAK